MTKKFRILGLVQDRLSPGFVLPISQYKVPREQDCEASCVLHYFDNSQTDKA